MARSTMASLIQRVRELTGAGTAEYTLGTAVYWSDDQLQTVLDRTRLDVLGEPLAVVPQLIDGVYQYRDYRSRWGDYEQTSGGTALFIVRDAGGTAVATSAYTPDYDRGVVSFTADTRGTAYLLTARSYDVYGAAAQVLEGWAGQLARLYDFAEDGQSFKRSQMAVSLRQLAAGYRAQSREGTVSAEWERSDLAPPDDPPRPTHGARP